MSTVANKLLKTLLHMCAILARTHREEFRKYFERKIAEGKHAMCVLNAIRNKIVQRIYACDKEKSVRNKLSKLLAEVIAFYLDEIRKMIYTTNVVEGMHNRSAR